MHTSSLFSNSKNSPFRPYGFFSPQRKHILLFCCFPRTRCFIVIFVMVNGSFDNLFLANFIQPLKSFLLHVPAELMTCIPEFRDKHLIRML